MRFSRSFVLNTKWIRLLEYECDIGRPCGTSSRLLSIPALPRWAKLGSSLRDLIPSFDDGPVQYGLQKNVTLEVPAFTVMDVTFGEKLRASYKVCRSPDSA